MNHPFNQPHPSRWIELDSQRPENMPFAEWAAEQRLRSQNESWARFEGADVVQGAEALLRAESQRQQRRRTAQTEGWKAGEPGE